MSAGGNLGLGINPATATLHVNGLIKLEGTNTFEFGSGIVGKEINAGKIGYNIFSQNALVIIGGGTSTANRAVYFYADGGVTFTGPAYTYGNQYVGGTLTRPATGNNDMLPLAYGTVDGTVNPAVIMNGSGNFTAVRNSNGFYGITVNGVTLTDANHTAVVSCVRSSVTGGTFLWSATDTFTGGITVVSNGLSDQKFSFIIYKSQ